MADIVLKYESTPKTLAITLTELASSATATAGRASAAVDNSVDRYMDVLVHMKVDWGVGSLDHHRMIYLLAYGSTGGTTYPDGITGTDAAVTISSVTNFRRLGYLYGPNDSILHRVGPFSLRLGFGGRLPQRWGIILINSTGFPLSSTAADLAITYQGVHAHRP